MRLTLAASTRTTTSVAPPISGFGRSATTSRTSGPPRFLLIAARIRSGHRELGHHPERTVRYPDRVRREVDEHVVARREEPDREPTRAVRSGDARPAGGEGDRRNPRRTRLEPRENVACVLTG